MSFLLTEEFAFITVTGNLFYEEIIIPVYSVIIQIYVYVCVHTHM